MLYSEIIAVCSQIHTKHINTLCGQNVLFLNVKPGGALTNYRVLERKPNVSQQKHRPLFKHLNICRHAICQVIR
jgi:hypothetical protein